MVMSISRSRDAHDVFQKHHALFTSGILSVVFLKIYKKVGNMTFGRQHCRELYLSNPHNGIPKVTTNEAKSLWKKPLMWARLGLEGRGLSWMDEFFSSGLKNDDEI